MRHAQTLLVFLALCSAAPALAAGPWSIPAEGSCEPRLGGDTAPPADALPLPFRVGEVLDERKIDLLKAYLPEELWEKRDRFFYPGMQLEIGPCYRDYSPPAFFAETTERFRGQAKLAADGALVNHSAGLPFPPDSIDPNDPQAGLRWAWNRAARYRAGGSFGKAQLTLLASDLVQRFTGEFFFVPLARRADRPGSAYRFPATADGDWAAGGESRNVDTGKECAFRQYANGTRLPDLFVWNVALRKVRRATSPDSEFPLPACLADASIGNGFFLHGDVPALHAWKVVGVRDVLAPINARVPAYPKDKARGFGPAGVSFANDRWELRRALVLEGRLKEGTFGDGVTRYVWYLDLQTLFPLYYAAFRGEAPSAGLGYFVGRFSEDRPDYPKWADDPARPVRVLDQVATALIDWNKQDSVRAEYWEAVALPSDDGKLARDLSQSSLRGR